MGSDSEVVLHFPEVCSLFFVHHNPLLITLQQIAQLSAIKDILHNNAHNNAKLLERLDRIEINQAKQTCTEDQVSDILKGLEKELCNTMAEILATIKTNSKHGVGLYACRDLSDVAHCAHCKDAFRTDGRSMCSRALPMIAKKGINRMQKSSYVKPGRSDKLVGKPCNLDIDQGSGSENGESKDVKIFPISCESEISCVSVISEARASATQSDDQAGEVLQPHLEVESKPTQVDIQNGTSSSANKVEHLLLRGRYEKETAGGSRVLNGPASSQQGGGSKDCNDNDSLNTSHLYLDRATENEPVAVLQFLRPTVNTEYLSSEPKP